MQPRHVRPFAVVAVWAFTPVKPEPLPTKAVADTFPLKVWLPVKLLPPLKRANPESSSDDEVEEVAILDTKASRRLKPPNVVWKAPAVVGKLVVVAEPELVEPVT